MRKLTFIVCFTAIFSFSFGIYWGFYSKDRKKNNGIQLNILAEVGAFPEAFLVSFYKYTGIRVHVEHYSTDKEFQEGLKKANFDLVQIRDKTKKWLSENQVADYESPWEDEVNADFQKFKSDISVQSFIPFAWSADIYVYNKAKFKPPETLKNIPKNTKISKAQNGEDIKQQLSSSDVVLIQSPALAQLTLDDTIQFWQPKEKTPLTVFLISILKSSQTHKQAQMLIDYLLSVEGAKTYALTSKKASTVDVMNLTDLPEPLKPIFLRQLQIDRLY